MGQQHEQIDKEGRLFRARLIFFDALTR